MASRLGNTALAPSLGSTLASGLRAALLQSLHSPPLLHAPRSALQRPTTVAYGWGEKRIGDEVARPAAPTPFIHCKLVGSLVVHLDLSIMKDRKMSLPPEQPRCSLSSRIRMFSTFFYIFSRLSFTQKSLLNFFKCRLFMCFFLF